MKKPKKMIVTAVVVVSVFVRLLLFSLGFSKTFQNIHFVTPPTSYKGILEGLKLMEMGYSPYIMHTCLHNPIILHIFKLVLLVHPVLVQCFYIVVDVLLSLLLLKISKVLKKERKNDEEDSGAVTPLFVMIFYSLNPLTIMSCVSLSTVIFRNLFLCIFFYLYVCKKHKTIQTLCLAILTYFTVYPVIFIVLVTLFENNNRARIKRIRQYCVFLIALLGISTWLQGSFDFLSVYESIFYVKDLTPNWGVFWYFFAESFSDFRLFFCVLFHIHLVYYVYPLYVRFKNQKVFPVMLYIGMISFFKAYPSFGDHVFFYSTVLLFFTPRVLKYEKYFLITFIMILLAIISGPIFYKSWIARGTGNANFFYFITIIFLMGNVIFICDFTNAKLKAMIDKKLQQK